MLWFDFLLFAYMHWEIIRILKSLECQWLNVSNSFHSYRCGRVGSVSGSQEALRSGEGEVDTGVRWEGVQVISFYLFHEKHWWKQWLTIMSCLLSLEMSLFTLFIATTEGKCVLINESDMTYKLFVIAEIHSAFIDFFILCTANTAHIFRIQNMEIMIMQDTNKI